jgi:hypothetical protein
MRLPRVQFRVSLMMVVVAIAALLLGVQATRRRWVSYQREAAYHADCARFYALTAERRFEEVKAVHFRADENPKRYRLSSQLTRPGEWADSCRRYAADHHVQKVYWESRW